MKLKKNKARPSESHVLIEDFEWIASYAGAY